MTKARAMAKDKAVDRERKTMLSTREHRETAVLAELGDQESKTRLDLLYEVGKKVGSVSQLARLVEQVMPMTQRTLNASASSVLLVDDEEQELLFEIAKGQAGKQLRRVRLSTHSGIAGWVVRHGKPLIVNDVNKDERFNKAIDVATGFVTRSIVCVPLVVHRKIIGVIEVLNKQDGSDFSKRDLEALVPVASTAAMSIENARLHQTVLDAYKSTIKALAAAIDAKDSYTRGHSQRVTEYTLLGGISLSLSPEELEVLEYAAILHDIGKIGIPDGILCKAGPLTDGEWDIMHEHSLIGANMIEKIPFLEQASKLVLYHHERYDGTGYPEELKGEDIPIGARLLAVADAFDTMTTDRWYHGAISVDDALGELGRGVGTQFCPVAVEAFVSGSRMNVERLSTSPVLESWQPVSGRLIKSMRNGRRKNSVNLAL